MPDKVDETRRRFVRRTVWALGAAHMGILNTAESEGASRELTAVARAREWLNSPPLAANALAGRVILVQFCTYTCINWLRTLPYVRMWSERFGRELLVLGVHTPEFVFEHNIENVRRALRQLRVGYPVVIDNDYSIWRAFGNNYWPALYFFNARGQIRDRHFGEGRYEQSEKVLQRLLVEAGGANATGRAVGSVDAAGVEAQADWAALRSPENYLG